MPKQMTFSAAEFASKKKVTRRERFLAEMEAVVPWSQLEALIRPHYPAGKRGRPPVGIGRMLRLYFIQQWYALGDEAVEDAVTDSQALRGFVGIDLTREAVPDATTLLNFRHLLERHALTRTMFEHINASLADKGLLLRQGTLVDATILNAPSSTKNEAKARDPEMHQTKKGNQWYHGMKAHIGVDADSGLVHTLTTTAAHASDVSQAHALLHGKEREAWADAGYIGVEKRPEADTHCRVRWHVAAKRSKLKAMTDGPLKELRIRIERAKAQIRARVEHPFHVIKNLFGHRKVRYRGLAKNTVQLYALFALANLFMARGRLMGALRA